jgi:hypothetical protein
VARRARTPKRTEPVTYQGIRTPEPEPPPKKTRNELHRPGKRIRDDQGAPDLEPSYKRRSPLGPQDIQGGLGKADRLEKYVDDAVQEAKDASEKNQYRETLVIGGEGEQTSNVKATGPDTTDLARSAGTDKTDEVHRESIGGSATVGDPCQERRNDMHSTKDEHLPQVLVDLNTIQDDQDRGGKGHNGAIRRSVHRMEAGITNRRVRVDRPTAQDQLMDTNAEGSEMVGDPCQVVRHNRNSTKGEYRPQANDPDANQDDQDRGGQGHRGTIRGSVHGMKSARTNRYVQADRMTVQDELMGKDRGGEQDPDIKVKGSDTTDLVRSVGTDETDKVHRENAGDSGTAFDPHQSLNDDMNLAKDEHLPQDEGPDAGQDDQHRDGTGHNNVIQRSGHGQHMDTNVDVPRGTSARDEKKCADISNALMLVEEKQWKVGRPNRETIAMDTEANNTNVLRIAMDTEADETNANTGKEDGAPESGLSNMDRESIGNPGAEMETALPKVLGKLSGDQYPQTGTDPTHGKTMVDQPDAAGDANMTTDSAPNWHNQGGTEVETLQDNEAGTAIRSCKRRMSVENSGDTEPPAT